VCCLISTAWTSLGQEPEAGTLEYLLNPADFPKGWVFYSAETGVNLEKVWQLSRDADPRTAVLVCTGKPDGYLRTEKLYDNYELGLEWMFPNDPNGNSGILLHVSDRDMIWPKAIQVQFHRPTAGSVFPNGGAKTDNMLTEKDLAKPVGEWNTCVVTCEGGRISVVMNGKKVGEVTGCMPQRGAIALQSEGSEIHFRKFWVRPLNAPASESTAPTE